MHRSRMFPAGASATRMVSTPHEATAHGGQSMALQPGQLAPFNQSYERFNTTESSIVPDPTITDLDSYGGG